MANSIGAHGPTFELLRHRPVTRQTEGQALAAVGGFAVGPGLFGGELEFATEGVQGFVHVFVEQVEEVGGGETGVGLGEVGVLVFLGEVAEAGDFGGLDAFEGVGGGHRGAGFGLAGVRFLWVSRARHQRS